MFKQSVSVTSSCILLDGSCIFDTIQSGIDGADISNIFQAVPQFHTIQSACFLDSQMQQDAYIELDIQIRDATLCLIKGEC